MEFGVLDAKGHRAVRAGPAFFSTLTQVATRRTRASLAQAHQLELGDVAVQIRHRYRAVLGDVDRFGLMMFVHAVGYRCAAAAATTTATIGSHSKPGWRLTVMKSLTPKIA